MKRDLRVAIIGCGNRGADVYARHLTEVGVTVSHLVEPRPARLSEVAARHGVPAQAQFAHWDDFFALGRVADAVVIATPDDAHIGPAVQALALGYDVLLEKPICLHEEELDVLQRAEAASTGRVSVCHVLRAAPFFRAVSEVLSSGRLGQLVGINLVENVAFWHYAHSYVRGNWRASPPAAPFILAKSCHDLDVLRWFAGRPPIRVSSSGGLHHFRPQQAPPGAAQRCVTCPVPDCPFDARSIYRSRPLGQWPLTVLMAGGHTLEQALEDGPYGECVYLGKNNVPDHQVVTVEFADGLQAELTVSAFTHNNTRTLKVMGSHGELRGHLDHGEVEVHDFRTGGREVIRVDTAGNHGGGDVALVAGWAASLRGEAPVPTPLAESLDSHRMAFAAEKLRLDGVKIPL
ncbi:gfo/Idh/MocA family oxidoreductase [Deinococcus cavernae]|uniref:Gfo/Idh/MocA family oxidoreductase n=1 Tax=Deinococcus cavernae TaxID=2320857 RepID=A0A418V4P7_9DEIO|nr:Gfo/Idh/MocA family oxidoreductase [Deinococcus cavernae]RJF71069.1 gfo/Idh/MocA family oxidoreductase [Deinococcus cavernae]